MTLAEFHARISRALRRGTSQDDIIPDVVSEAALFLEQNYSFKYMRRVVQVTIDPLGMAPERIDVPSDHIKSWRFIRVVGPANAYSSAPYRYLKRVEAEDVTALSLGCPLGYYLDGDTQIVLDAVVKESTKLDIAFVEYTNWPTDTTASPRLLKIGHNLLRAQTLMQFSMDTRDPRLLALLKQMRDEALVALLGAQEESEWQGTDNYMTPEKAW